MSSQSNTPIRKRKQAAPADELGHLANSVDLAKRVSVSQETENASPSTPTTKNPTQLSTKSFNSLNRRQTPTKESPSGVTILNRMEVSQKTPPTFKDSISLPKHINPPPKNLRRTTVQKTKDKRALDDWLGPDVSDASIDSDDSEEYTTNSGPKQKKQKRFNNDKNSRSEKNNTSIHIEPLIALSEDEEPTEHYDVMKDLLSFDPHWKPTEKIQVQDVNFDDDLNFNGNCTEIDNHASDVIQQRNIKRKYNGINYFPEGLNEVQLRKRIKKHLYIIEDVLANLDTSYYYQRAVAISKSFKKSSISAGEFDSLPKDEMLCGYYGTVRHSMISNMIHDRYESKLIKLANKDPLVKFFTLDTFVLHFLCQELVTEMMRTDLGVSKGEAIETLKTTNDYGFYVTDKLLFIPVAKN